MREKLFTSGTLGKIPEVNNFSFADSEKWRPELLRNRSAMFF
jgi:hypothetical protein